MLSPREGVKNAGLGGTQDFCKVPGVTDVWQILELQNVSLTILNPFYNITLNEQVDRMYAIT